MRRSSWAVVAIVGVSLVAGRALADDKEDVVNGAKTWATALLDGDDKGVKAHSVGDETEMARWDGMSKLLTSFKKLGDAASAKYGEEGAMLSRAFKKPDFTALQKDSTIVVNGGDASITGKDGKVMKLKKDGGEWKVVLSSLGDAGGKMEPKQVAAMSAAASSTADEIKDGKYPTYIEAMKALGQKMAAAGAGGRRPAGAPGGAPAK